MPLTQPEEGKMLLIGCVIVESLERFWKSYPLEVCIMADVEEKGKTVRKAYTVFADEQGYFALENMPPGRYTLKGVIVQRGAPYLIWNEMRLPNGRWSTRSVPTPFPPLTGNIWPWSPVSNTYNFGYNIFVHTFFGEIKYYNLNFIDRESFETPRTYTRPYIEEYFVKKYPDSGWVPILKLMLPKY